MTTTADRNLEPMEKDVNEEETNALYLASGVAPLLFSPPEEEGANDNARLVEVVQGVVWRGAESAQAGSGEPEVEAYDFLSHRSELPRELDFSQSGSRRRGFLDEE